MKFGVQGRVAWVQDLRFGVAFRVYEGLTDARAGPEYIELVLTIVIAML